MTVTLEWKEPGPKPAGGASSVASLGWERAWLMTPLPRGWPPEPVLMGHPPDRARRSRCSPSLSWAAWRLTLRHETHAGQAAGWRGTVARVGVHVQLRG